MNPTFKMFREAARWDDGYAMSLCEQKRPTPLLVVLILFLVLKLRQGWCSYFGHDWETESHAGPESGHETFCCKRCGEYFEVIHY